MILFFNIYLKRNFSMAYKIKELDNTKIGNPPDGYHLIYINEVDKKLWIKTPLGDDYAVIGNSGLTNLVFLDVAEGMTIGNRTHNWPDESIGMYSLSIGASNEASGTCSFVMGNNSTTTKDTSMTIGDNSNNNSQYSFILSTSSNIGLNSVGSTILGGQSNNIKNSSTNSALIAGNTSNIYNNCLNSVIIGGYINNINSGLTTSTSNSVIVGGTNNTINSNNSVILGGNGITTNTDNRVYMNQLLIGSSDVAGITGNTTCALLSGDLLFYKNSTTKSIIEFSGSVLNISNNLYGPDPTPTQFNGSYTGARISTNSWNSNSQNSVVSIFNSDTSGNISEILRMDNFSHLVITSDDSVPDTSGIRPTIDFNQSFTSTQFHMGIYPDTKHYFRFWYDSSDSNINGYQFKDSSSNTLAQISPTQTNIYPKLGVNSLITGDDTVTIQGANIYSLHMGYLTCWSSDINTYLGFNAYLNGSNITSSGNTTYNGGSMITTNNYGVLKIGTIPSIAGGNSHNTPFYTYFNNIKLQLGIDNNATYGSSFIKSGKGLDNIASGGYGGNITLGSGYNAISASIGGKGSSISIISGNGGNGTSKGGDGGDITISAGTRGTNGTVDGKVSIVGSGITLVSNKDMMFYSAGDYHLVYPNTNSIIFNNGTSGRYLTFKDNSIYGDLGLQLGTISKSTNISGNTTMYGNVSSINGNISNISTTLSYNGIPYYNTFTDSDRIIYVTASANRTFTLYIDLNIGTVIATLTPSVSVWDSNKYYTNYCFILPVNRYMRFTTYAATGDGTFITLDINHMKFGL